LTEARETKISRESLLEMPSGKLGSHHLVLLFALVFALWHVLTNVYLTEPGLWQNAIHFGGFAFLASVTISPWGKNSTRRWAWTFDIAYGLLIAAAALWVAWSESDLYERSLAVTGQGWQLNVIDWSAGLLLIFACIDLSRRVSGWVIPILIVLSLSYILFLGTKLPGVFRSASLPIDDVLFRTLYNDEGMFGILANISVTNITLFMIFGGFLVVSGASNFVIEISKIVAGRIKGGAAFVAVLSSALTGTISGSAVANTASTGVITIPLMKSNGFRPQFAGGVEAAASTGGQLMPPIMGAGAFVMASYTSIPYGTIVAVSIVPAILYFLSVAFIVRIEALKYDAGAEIDLTVDKGKMLSGGLVFIIPLTVMIWLLMTGVTPSYAACWAIATLIVTSWVTSIAARLLGQGLFKPVEMGPSRIAESLVSGVRSAILTAILLTAIGIMNNAIVTSGVGNGFSLMIAQWSQGSLALAIVLIGLASLVLGMGLLVDHPLVAKVATGMSTAEAWELVRNIPFEIAVTIRPVMVDQSVQTAYLLSAHLIIFWLSQDSNVTPPVCLAAFAAAGIAGSRPMATGFESWKIAKGLYIVPLLFAYTPLITGDFLEVLQVGFFALFGIYATNALIQWYSEGPIGIIGAVLLVAGAVGAYWPLAIVPNLIGAALVVAAVVLSSKKRASVAAVAT